MKKILIAALMLALGCMVAEASDMMKLGLLVGANSSVTPVDKLPYGVFYGKTVKTKTGMMSFPFLINIEKTQSVELELKVVGGGTTSISLSGVRMEKGKKSIVIPVTCKVFEINGKPVSGVPCEINGWKKMTTFELKDGDTIVIKLELEKKEE